MLSKSASLLSNSLDAALDEVCALTPGANNREINKPAIDAIRFIKLNAINSFKLISCAYTALLIIGTATGSFSLVHFSFAEAIAKPNIYYATITMFLECSVNIAVLAFTPEVLRFKNVPDIQTKSAFIFHHLFAQSH